MESHGNFFFCSMKLFSVVRVMPCRSLGALLPVSSLNRLADLAHSLLASALFPRMRVGQGMLSSALSTIEAPDLSPGSLPTSSLAAEQMQALAEASADCAPHRDALQAALAARDAAEERVDELRALLAKERQQREQEKQAWHMERLELLALLRNLPLLGL